MFLVAGCLTREALYDDLRETRDDAYESWLRIRESGDIPIPAENLTLDESVRIALLYNKPGRWWCTKAKGPCTA